LQSDRRILHDKWQYHQFLAFDRHKDRCSGLDKGVQIGKLLGGITYQYLFEKNHLILKQVTKKFWVLKNID